MDRCWLCLAAIDGGLGEVVPGRGGVENVGTYTFPYGGGPFGRESLDQKRFAQTNLQITTHRRPSFLKTQLWNRLKQDVDHGLSFTISQRSRDFVGTGKIGQQRGTVYAIPSHVGAGRHGGLQKHLSVPADHQVFVHQDIEFWTWQGSDFDGAVAFASVCVDANDIVFARCIDRDVGIASRCPDGREARSQGQSGQV